MKLYKALLDKKSGVIEDVERGYTKIKISSIKYIDKAALTLKEEINNIIYKDNPNYIHLKVAINFIIEFSIFIFCSCNYI